MASDATITQTQEPQVILPPGLPAKEELEKTALYIERSAGAIKITSKSMCQIAVDEMQELQTKLDQLTERRMTITRPMDAAKKAVMDLFRGPTERCETAIANLKKSILTFQREEKAREQEAERKRQEEERKARIAAEQEQLRIQAEADRKARELAEQRRLAVQAEQKALEAAARGDTEAEEKAAAEALERQQEEARLAAEAEASRQAAEAQKRAAMVMAPAVQAEATKVRGIVTQAPWTAALVDDTDATKLALLKYVLENPQYINFIDVNMKPIIQVAKALQGNTKIPGIRVYQDERLTSRRSK